MVCIDRVLNHQGQDSSSKGKGKGDAASEPIPTLTSPEARRMFLYTHLTSAQLDALDSAVAAFKTGYRIVPGYLDDMQVKVREICDSSLDIIIDAAPTLDTVAWRAVYAECIEAFVFDRVHDKVLAPMRSECKVENTTWNMVVRHHAAITPEALGIPDEFRCNQGLAIGTARGIETARSPLEMHNCIKDTIDCISSTTQAHLKAQRKGNVAIATDDLLPMLAMVLVQTQTHDFPTYLRYLERLGTSYGSATEIGFNLVSTRAAVTFVLSEPQIKALCSATAADDAAAAAAADDANTAAGTATNHQQQQQQQHHHHTSLGPPQSSRVTSRRHTHSTSTSTGSRARTGDAQAANRRTLHSNTTQPHLRAQTQPPKPRPVSTGDMSHEARSRLGQRTATDGDAKPALKGATATVEDMGGFLSRLALGAD